VLAWLAKNSSIAAWSLARRQAWNHSSDLCVEAGACAPDGVPDELSPLEGVPGRPAVTAGVRARPRVVELNHTFRGDGRSRQSARAPDRSGQLSSSST